MSFDAKADTPVAGSALAAGDKFVFGDVSADGWDTTTADQLLDGIARVAAATHVLGLDATGEYVQIRMRGGDGVNDLVAISHDGAHANVFNPDSGEVRIFLAGMLRVQLAAAGVTIDNGGYYTYTGRSRIYSPADGLVKLTQADSTSGATLVSPTVTPAQVAANQPAYAGLTGRFNRLTSDASRDIQGIAVGVDGEERVLINVGSQNIVIKNDSASATAAGNKILTHTGADITLGPQGAVSLVYDGTSGRWRTY